MKIMMLFFCFLTFQNTSSQKNYLPTRENAEARKWFEQARFGTHDMAGRILPVCFVSTDIQVKNGVHLMVLDKPEEITEKIRNNQAINLFF